MSKRNILFSILTLAFCVSFANQGKAERYIGDTHKKSAPNLKNSSAGCEPAVGFEWLNINNIRCRVNTGGDMWYGHDGMGGRYYVPAKSTKTSLFSGSLWIGGRDINKQLKLAAHRFRDTGVDFWAGPLTADKTASIDAETCVMYDRFFKIDRKMVDDFLAHTDPETGAYIGGDGYSIPKEIIEWPGNGHPDDQTERPYLAPFKDVDGDGVYDPKKGDYPYYDINNDLCDTPEEAAEDPDQVVDNTTPIPESDPDLIPEDSPYHIKGGRLADQVIKGDQTLWWVFNDKGNIHKETEGEAIGLEIRAQAFAFSTADEINNMTFYSYEIINRSTYTLTETFFSPWVDTDLGNAWDDYVGCDVQRGLGYCYNGKEVDGSGSVESYGEQPPAVGVDFFQGPYMDDDKLDNPKGLCDESINGVNFGDGIPDNERYGMRRFVYHNNTSDKIFGDPKKAPDYYNYLRGIWKDNSRMQFGGNGHPTGGAVGPDADFMFPGDTDPCNWGTGTEAPLDGYNTNGKYWTERQSGNAAGDRRFMQSAGPFTLEPGAVNYITVGIPWARASAGGAWASVEKLRLVDDKCQALFDNCFKVIEGPDAPDLSFREMDGRLICYITNSATSNNANESFDEVDPAIDFPETTSTLLVKDNTYTFEGYKIYQLKDETVSPDDLNDMDKARLIAQFDVKNNVTRIVNLVLDQETGFDYPVIEVEGSDNGIKHAFEITEDLFAEGDKKLVNFKNYHYMAIAYAHNEYLPYDPDPHSNLSEGQKTPYRQSRKNIKAYTAIPHKTMNGLKPMAEFGDSFEVKRLQGMGNGGNAIELSDADIAAIMAKPAMTPTTKMGDDSYPMVYQPTYKKGHSPINVTVIDPIKLKSADYELTFSKMREKVYTDVLADISVVEDNLKVNTSTWYLKAKFEDGTEKTYAADTSIDYQFEQVFPELGIAVSLIQPYNTGSTEVGKTLSTNSNNQVEKAKHYENLAERNGFISSEFTFQGDEWMDGVRDIDIPGSPFNWILAGNYYGGSTYVGNDTKVVDSKAAYFTDPNGDFENIANGTWTPWALVAAADDGGKDYSPLFTKAVKNSVKRLNRVHSVDIVMTPDKSKWTRCAVFEVCSDTNLAQNNGHRFTLRRAPSVDKDGNPAAEDAVDSENPEDAAYISARGMGWFPGYAIDLESGARLNMSFTEDSYLAGLNGNDMLFNPAERDMNVAQELDPNVIDQVSGKPLFGGKHFAMVWGINNVTVTPSEGYDEPPFFMNFPAYDAGRSMVTYMDSIVNYYEGNPLLGGNFDTEVKLAYWRNIDYVGLPMAIKGQEWLANEAKLKIRVSVPYKQGMINQQDLEAEEPSENIAFNGYNPAYAFSTKGVVAIANDEEKAQSDLDLVGVVPNPYFAYSSYERNALDNKVKIINLPDKCTVSIYNVNGTMVRQLTKDTPNVTSIDWDLKNFANVPIAGGVYIFHVQSDQGERIVKWFGTLRQVDINKF